MSKKAKRYDEGGVTEGPNKNISDDIRERAMKAVAEGGQKDEAVSVPKSTAAKLTPKSETKYEAAPKGDAGDKLRSELGISKPSAPKMIKDTGMKSKSGATADDVKLAPKMPKISDPLAKYEQAGPKRSEQAGPKKKSSSSDTDYSVGNAMRAGGKVSSASKRADGIATKGKTRGKIC